MLGWMKHKLESRLPGKISITSDMQMIPPSWQIDGKTMETMREFILGGIKITADGDCSHDIKRHLLLEGKVMTNLDSILKNRDIT